MAASPLHSIHDDTMDVCVLSSSHYPIRIKFSHHTFYSEKGSPSELNKFVAVAMSFTGLAIVLATMYVLR